MLIGIFSSEASCWPPWHLDTWGDHAAQNRIPTSHLADPAGLRGKRGYLSFCLARLRVTAGMLQATPELHCIAAVERRGHKTSSARCGLATRPRYSGTLFITLGCPPRGLRGGYGAGWRWMALDKHGKEDLRTSSQCSANAHAVHTHACVYGVDSARD